MNSQPTRYKFTELFDKKETLFFFAIIFIAILIRAIWAFFLAEDYWGDGYHNRWITIQSLSGGEYFDFKNRHLVWLPLYRLLDIAFSSITRIFSTILPFLLQLIYVLIITKWVVKSTPTVKINRSLFIMLFWPLPIMFAGFNLSECLALILVTYLFILLLKDRIPRLFLLQLFIFACLSALTRHEATAFLGVLGVILFLFRFRKEGVLIITGLVFGLFIFSIWNYTQINEPLFWLTSKFNASGAGAKDIIETYGLVARVTEALLAIFFVFPLIPFLFVSPSKFKHYWFTSVSKTTKEPVLLSTFIFILIFLLASFFFFHGADPKYLLLACFPFALLTADLINTISNARRKLIYSTILALIPIFMIIFSYRSLNLELERNTGSELSHIIEDDSNIIWCDFPTISLYAHWNPKQVRSSNQIASLINSNGEITPNTLLENNISYIIASDLDMSEVIHRFPFLNIDYNQHTDIIKDGVVFQLIHQKYPPQFEEWRLNENWFSQLRTFVLSKNKSISVWRISTTNP